MPNDYATRKEKAARAEELFAAYLDSRSIQYTRSAIENLVSRKTTDLIAVLAQSHPELREVRYLPDFRVMLPATANIAPHFAWCDVKSSRLIERESFRHYCDLDASGAPCYLAIVDLPTGTIAMVRVTDVVFVQDDWQPPTATGSTTWWRAIDLAATPHQIVKP